MYHATNCNDDVRVDATDPSSVMPSRNSFLLNSHCVAALNFHATTRMLTLVGSSIKSSQNCWIPSTPILFSSWGSSKDEEDTDYRVAKSKIKTTTKIHLFNTLYLCICCRAAPASCDPLRFSWILCSRGLDSGNSCQ